MENYNCPSCGEKTISFWQKQFTGPLKKIKCKNCDALISVSWFRSFFIIFLGMFIPLIIAWTIFIFLPYLMDIKYPKNGIYWTFTIGLILGLVIVVWSYHRFVPLVKKDA
jgi:hypothetical protein